MICNRLFYLRDNPGTKDRDQPALFLPLGTHMLDLLEKDK